MTFQHPEHFWMIAAAGAAVFIGYFILCLRGERILRLLGGRRLLKLRGSKIPHPATIVLRGAIVAIILTLYAGVYWLMPQSEQITQVPAYEGAEVCFAIDASRSSRARDIKFIDNAGNEKAISRFEFAKKIVLEARPSLSSGDAPCLVFFAATAINTVPVMIGEFSDVSWSYIEQDMKYADEYFVEYEIAQGSEFTVMMNKVLAAFSDKPTRKIAIIISDGEQETGIDVSNIKEEEAQKLREAAKKKSMKILSKEISEFTKKYELSVSILGIGNIGQASPIPKKVNSDGAVVAYHTLEAGPKKGQPVLTRPDPEFLFSAAQSLSGSYRHVATLEEAEKELARIFTREKKILHWKENIETSDIGWYFVLAGTVLLFIAPFLKSP